MCGPTALHAYVQHRCYSASLQHRVLWTGLSDKANLQGMCPEKDNMVLNRALCLLQYDGRSQEEVANMSFEARRKIALKGLQSTHISSSEGGGSGSSHEGSGTGRRRGPAPPAAESGSSQSPSGRQARSKSRHSSGQESGAGRWPTSGPDAARQAPQQATSAQLDPLMAASPFAAIQHGSQEAAPAPPPQQAPSTQLDSVTAASPFAAVQHSDGQQPRLDPLTAASPFATVGQQPQQPATVGLDPLMAASPFATIAHGLNPESDTH